MPDDRYREIVRTMKDHIAAGDIYQGVPSRRLGFPNTGGGFPVYRRLRVTNPAPYMFFVRMLGLELAGSSPEPLVRVEGRTVTSRPIAGTRPRGETELRDRLYEHELLADPKERAEHAMLVDLARNDLGRVCTPGTVRPSELMSVERFSKVMHIVSTVEGELAEGAHPLDALAVTFPAGTVTGAPKRRAMELIAELEPTRARSVRGRGRLLHVRGRSRLLHHDPDGGRRRRHGVRADGRRDRRRLRPGRRARRDHREGRGPAARDRGRGGLRDRGGTVILVVDHYDSFTYNLVQLLESLGTTTEVVKSDAETAEALVARRPDAVVLSPGPGRPEDAGCFTELLRILPASTPVLGVCLGHQAMGIVAGARVERATPVHGKASLVHHDGTGIFADVPNPFEAGRYHSLVVTREAFPDELELTAWSDDDLVMAARHRTLPRVGVQFHPESILTPDGPTIVRNFLSLLG